MKARIKKLFTFSLSETEQFDNHEIVESVNCPLKEMMCKVHLNEISNIYLESDRYRKAKDLDKSIDSLRIAFVKAAELMENPCTKCAQQLRLSLLKAMTSINLELEEIAKGIFGDKNYLPVYLKSVAVLKEFQNAKYLNTDQSDDAKGRFLGNYLN
jgi:hypothetical protein